MENAIEIKDVCVYYNSICVLEDINLNIKNKQFLGIIGPNGGGKSTLLKVILGLIKPAKGYIKIFGKPIRDNQKLLGYVPQFSNFNKQFPINVMDVVLMGRLAKNKKAFYKYSQQDKKIAETILKKLNMYDYRNKQISQLSGGQLQKVLIGRALAVEPKILLLDEPTASIDSKSKTQIYSLLKTLNKNITIVLVTHDMSAVSSYVDNIACLNKKLFFHGEAQLNKEIINAVYGCPIDLIAHGVPHRVLKIHEEGYND